MRSSASVAVRAASRVPFPRPAGFRLVIPGWPQWSWSQRDRAFILFGSYVAAVAVGLFAWGTLPGALILGFAFTAHVLSVADALRQAAFPPFGRWLPWISASTGLGLGYVPVMSVLWLVASPQLNGDREDRGFLINRWSYRHAQPRSGDWVGFVENGERKPRVGRIRGIEGQEIRRLDGRLTIDGQPLSRHQETRRGRLSEFTFAVPNGQILVECEARDREESELVLVDRRMVLGRAWAQHWPIWSRRILPQDHSE